MPHSYTPVAKNPKDLISILFEIFLKLNSSRPEVIPLDIKKIDAKTSLNIGIFKGYSFQRPADVIVKRIDNSAQILKKNGHNIIELEPPNFEEIYFLFFGIFNPCIMKKIQDLSDENSTNCSLIPNIYSRSGFSKCFNYYYWKILNSSPFKANFATKTGLISTYDFSILCKKRTLFLKNYVKYLMDLKIDIILCPTFPVASPPKEIADEFFFGNVYCVFSTFIGFPSGVVPTKKVDLEDQYYRNDANLKNEFEFRYNLAMKKSLRCPLGLQVIGFPYNEENILRIMNELFELSND